MTTKVFFLALAFLTPILATRAEVLLYDDFSYPDGNITNVSNGLWTRHSGSGGDSMVFGGKYEIDQARFDDVSRAFTQPNAGEKIYTSFTLNVSQLPSAAGTYFAHFKDDGAFNYLARVHIVATNTVVPGTYRLGIANVAGSYSDAVKLFPMDLATNANYQVVVSYDTLNYLSSLQVNPATDTDRTVVADDTVSGTAAGAIISTYAFRQAANEGVMTVDNLLVANSYSEVATNAAAAPTIAMQPQGGSFFVGNEAVLYAVGNGQGELGYQWRKDGAPLYDSATVSGATSPMLVLKSVGQADAGSYDVVVTANNGSGSATSQPAVVAVKAAEVPPFITSQPVSVTNAVGANATFTVQAGGAGPITYQWKFNGTDLGGATSNVLTLKVITSENAGFYSVAVSNPYGTTNSSAAYLHVLPPIATNIAYLHTLLDPNTWLPTNTTTLFDVQGIVTTHTNITTAGNAQFYIQDDTGGITVFVSGSSTFRPAAGDRVHVIAPLSHYNSLLELVPLPTNPLHVFEILSSGNPLPAPRDFGLGETNNIQLMETVIEGRLVSLTNVYFVAADGTAVFAAPNNYTVRNAAGETFIVRLDQRVTSVAGMVIPAFAYRVTGVMGQFLSATATPRNSGYQLMLTSPEDIVTTAPPADIRLGVSRSATTTTLTWNSAPGLSYTVYATSDLSAPFAPIATGVASGGAQTSYTDTSSAEAKFYRVSAP